MTIQRVFLISCAVVGLGLTVADAQEKATYTAPVTANRTEGEIYQVILARKPDWRVQITFVDNLGNEVTDNHSGITGGADVLVKALNKANLSTKSLECRALEHLRDEGKIPAFVACSGTPQ